MNRRIFAVLFIVLFLMTMIGFVSAGEKCDVQGADSYPVNVTILWNDSNQTQYRPVQLTVNLLRDGEVVESVNLSDSNSWNSTFNTPIDCAKYQVKLVDDLKSYSVSYKGNVESGFVITNTLNKTL